MKAGGSSKQASRRPRFRLEHAAAFFVVAAVLFFGYSVIQASFGGSPALGSGLGVGSSSRREMVRVGGGDGAGDSGTGAKLAASSPAAVAEQSPCPEAPEKTTTVMVTKLVYGSTVQNPRAYHVVTTAAGFSNHWQARVHYYWFKKQRDACLREPSCDMGGFTRVLHSGKPDDLMDEVPTVVVDPLPSSVSKNTTYIVLNRPYAFLEWINRVSIPEKYFVMCETDHLFMRPMPNLMNGEGQGAAIFTYIVPWKYPEIVRKFVGNVSDAEVRKVPQIGNSPTFISVAEARTLFPIWYNTTLEIFEDKEAHEAWNWVLEMYGYSLATYRARQHEHMAVVNILAHPPFDNQEVDYQGSPFYLLHLTYPCRFDKFGNMTDNSTLAAWTFDKREYSVRPPPRNLPMPPAYVKNNLVRLIIAMLNEATDNLPCWDDYRETSKVSKCAHYTQKLEDRSIVTATKTTTNGAT